MEKDNKTKKEELEIAAHYIQTFSDTAREPFLILNPDLKVVGANGSFYKNFKVTKKETDNKLIYELGNGQWNIPELKDLLENILPNKGVFNDFEVTHEFPDIGLKIMLLNARQLDSTKQILLAIEDITLKRAIEIKLANYTKDLEVSVKEKTQELEVRIDELTRLTNLMVGRELRIIELKKEVAEFKKEKDAK